MHCTGSHRCSSTSQVSWDEGGVAPCTHTSSLEQGKHAETGATLTHLQDHPDWQVDFRGHLTRKPHAGELGFSTEATPVLTVRRQRQPRHLTPHGSRGRVQTGSPTSDGVFVGAEEPWQQQQVEEVDQRQDVVAEQAGCRHRETCGHMNQMTTLSWMPS